MYPLADDISFPLPLTGLISPIGGRTASPVLTSSPTYPSWLEVGDSHFLAGFVSKIISYHYLNSVPSPKISLRQRVERHQLGVQHSQVPYVRYLALHNGLSRRYFFSQRWSFGYGE